MCLLWLIIIFTYGCHAIAPWTTCVIKQAESGQELYEFKKILDNKDTIDDFTQLICSWNAQRPAKGYLRFKVRVRDQTTKRWLDWHPMYEWGASTQRSFFDCKALSSYHHVRLEMAKNRTADGFHIVIEPMHGAQLGCIKQLAISLSRLDLFEHEMITKEYTKLKPIHIKPVPLLSQMKLPHVDYEVLCSPSATWMLTSYLLGTALDPIHFANSVYDHGLAAYGSWPFNTAHAFEAADHQYPFHVERLHSFKELHAQLDKGIPVVVSVRGTIRGAPKSYPGGHLLLVVGYNPIQKHVICHDPAALHQHAVLKHYPLKNFLRAWERSYRLSYIAQGS